jgi:large subunit ribosomal protein L17
MRHKLKGRKLNRTSSHRQALLANLAISLVKHEGIQTTLPKARELRPFIEKLVTLGKKQTLHARRLLASRLRDQDAALKILSELAPHYKERAGGYCRIVKTGFRHGDFAPTAFISFVDREKNQAASKEAAPSEGKKNAEKKPVKAKKVASSAE